MQILTGPVGMDATVADAILNKSGQTGLDLGEAVVPGDASGLLSLRHGGRKRPLGEHKNEGTSQ
jgi:hypothetical protein